MSSFWANPQQYAELIGAELIGFVLYVALFGISFSSSILCLYYLFKHWRMEVSHYIITNFTLLLSVFNLGVMAWRAETMYWNIYQGGSVLSLRTSLDVTLADGVISISYVPLFLWISDAFLIHRLWVVWNQDRVFVLLPGLAFVVSVVIEIVWLVQATVSTNSTALYDAVDRWIPALGFSLGIDALATGMIAGRLVYYHRRQRSLRDCRSTSYLPLMTIFIESATLSTLSKIIQLGIGLGQNYISCNPLVIPICTLASNLIILRKALGADVSRMMPQPQLSTLRFPSQRTPHSLTLQAASVPGGFESYLIESIGGPLEDYFRGRSEKSEKVSPGNGSWRSSPRRHSFAV